MDNYKKLLDTRFKPVFLSIKFALYSQGEKFS